MLLFTENIELAIIQNEFQQKQIFADSRGSPEHALWGWFLIPACLISVAYLEEQPGRDLLEGLTAMGGGMNPPVTTKARNGKRRRRWPRRAGQMTAVQAELAGQACRSRRRAMLLNIPG